MRFKQLADMIIEAKNEKPGQRFHTASNAEGPAGMSSSPIGKSNFNPAKPDAGNPLPSDTKAQSVKNTETVLRNALRLIKGDAHFRNQVSKILESYAKKRKNITAAQEKILTYNPGIIDKNFTDVERLKRIIDAIGEGDERIDDFKADLAAAEDNMAKYQEQLDDVISVVQNVLGENEDTSLKYQDALIDLIQATAAEEYEKMMTEDNAGTQLQSLDQLDSKQFSEEALEQEELRIQLLRSLLSDSENVNPLYKFFYLAQEQYQQLKDSEAIFKKLKANTQNVTVESLYNRLPMGAFNFFYNATRDDLPLRSLTGKRREQAKAASPIRDLLGKIKTEEDFNAHRAELLTLCSELQVDAGRKQAILDIINGPFKRKGATVVNRLQGLLRGVLKERFQFSYDRAILEALSKYGVY